MTLAPSRFFVIVIFAIAALQSTVSHSEEQPNVRGEALVIGLNRVDPQAYAGWKGLLQSAVKDANSIEQLTLHQGFTVSRLVDGDATRDAVLHHLKAAANSAESGDLFVLFFAGHGGKLPDLSGDEPVDVEDETLCLYDGQLADDELKAALAKFRKGVRVLVILDTSHINSTANPIAIEEYDRSFLSHRHRALPMEVANGSYQERSSFYNSILEEVENVSADIVANVILFKACQQNQLATETDGHGVFTRALLNSLDEGRFRGNYHALSVSIQKQMPPTQSPMYLLLGDHCGDFEAESPFIIDAREDHIEPCADTDILD